MSFTTQELQGCSHGQFSCEISLLKSLDHGYWFSDTAHVWSECEDVQIQSRCFPTNYWRHNSLVPLMFVLKHQWHSELWSRGYIPALEWPSGGCWVLRVAIASNNDYSPPNVAVCGDCPRLFGAVKPWLSIITGAAVSAEGCDGANGWAHLLRAQAAFLCS